MQLGQWKLIYLGVFDLINLFLLPDNIIFDVEVAVGLALLGSHIVVWECLLFC